MKYKDAPNYLNLVALRRMLEDRATCYNISILLNKCYWIDKKKSPCFQQIDEKKKNCLMIAERDNTD